MNRDVATMRAFESIYRARLVIVLQNVKSLPVIDDDRRSPIDTIPSCSTARSSSSNRSSRS
jgi:CBS-domain-containing membrane protein